MIDAIVLKASPFQDHHLLVTFLTKDFGLLKGIAKYALRQKNPLFGVFQPLNQVEIEVRESQSELKKIEAASLLNGHFALRNSYSSIEGSLQMVETVLKTQFQAKPAPLIYALFESYLQIMPEVLSVGLLVKSFQFKCLKHEGLFHLQDRCTKCQEKLFSLAISPEGVFCEREAPNDAIHFSEKEGDLLFGITFASSKALLKELEGEKEFLEKTDLLVDLLIR